MSGDSAKKWREENPDKVKDRIKKSTADRSASHYYREYSKRPDVQVRTKLKQAKARAKRQGLPFDIEIEDIIVPEFCPVLGLKLEAGERGNPNSPSLDKLIPSLGYVKGNIRVISSRANSLKNNATLEELKALVSYVERETNLP